MFVAFTVHCLLSLTLPFSYVPMPPVLMLGTTVVLVTSHSSTDGSSLIVLWERANDASTRKLELMTPS